MLRDCITYVLLCQGAVNRAAAPRAKSTSVAHRIRLHLSSSRFPLWDRNTNTGNDPATERGRVSFV